MNAKPIDLDATRDLRFGEIIVVHSDYADIYNTSGLNDCPPELWDTMDTEGIAKELGAVRVQQNGPKFWMMDAQTIDLGETVSFGGLEARWGARLPLALLRPEGAVPYEVFNPKKTQKMVYDAGKPVFELVDPDGHEYVLQAHSPQFSISALDEIGEQMNALPTGWTARTRVLSETLVLDLGPHMTIHGVGDEFHQYYTRIPEGA